MATWLDAAGYDTILIGKYLNRYGLDRNGNYAPTTHRPPGWDRWYAPGRELTPAPPPTT
jgi:hypothetical protein